MNEQKMVSVQPVHILCQAFHRCLIISGRILYYIVFGVMGGAIIIFIITIAVAVVMFRTTRQIQRTKRTLCKHMVQCGTVPLISLSLSLSNQWQCKSERSS